MSYKYSKPTDTFGNRATSNGQVTPVANNPQIKDAAEITNDRASPVRLVFGLCLFLLAFIGALLLIAPSARHSSLADYLEDINVAREKGDAQALRLAVEEFDHVVQYADEPVEHRSLQAKTK